MVTGPCRRDPDSSAPSLTDQMECLAKDALGQIEAGFTHPLQYWFRRWNQATAPRNEDETKGSTNWYAERHCAPAAPQVVDDGQCAGHGISPGENTRFALPKVPGLNDRRNCRRRDPLEPAGSAERR